MTEFGEIPEEWVVYRLGDIVEKIVGGGTPSRKVAEYYQGDIPWATVKDLDNRFYKSNTVEHITTEAVNNSATNVINESKIIIATRMGLGRGFINKVPMAINQDLKALYNKAFIDIKYLLYWYLLKAELIQGIGKGSTVKGITLNDLKALLLPIPAKEEQQKIASILSTVDEHIDQTDKLIEKSKELKKGLMQKLLTKGIGHTELKMTELGEIPKEWSISKLRELGFTYNGLTGKNGDDFGEGKPYIPYKNVFNNLRIDLDYLDHVRIDKKENQNKVKYGDVIFTTSSETPEDVGMSSVLLNKTGELYLNSFCFGYRLNSLKLVLPDFVCYLLRGYRFRKIISKLAQGSTRYNLSKNSVLNISIPIPGVEEQQKIASILSSVDEKLDQYDSKKQKLQDLKKGLMQKLLTGKIRVKVS
ncbi:MAG: hypothetical protein APF76_18280 [Desulfitibacter sp. BRH_c19]|nr:MAG: hypothetical protein APF76_18280 [Desulfitibacter sp. BRH_c19]